MSLASCGSISLAKSCQDAWRTGSQSARGQVNMVDEANFHSPICSTFESLAVQPTVGCCPGGELGPYCWPIWATCVAVFGASHSFAEYTSQMWWLCWDIESCSGSDGQETTKQWPWPFSGARLTLGSALERLLSLPTELVVIQDLLFVVYHNPIEKWFVVS